MEGLPTTASSAFAAVGWLKRIDWSKAALRMRYGMSRAFSCGLGSDVCPPHVRRGLWVLKSRCR